MNDLRLWRRKHKYTQMGLADKLGVHWITVSKWERGITSPPPFINLALSCLEGRKRKEVRKDKD